jgi:hypothetical protein
MGNIYYRANLEKALELFKNDKKEEAIDLLVEYFPEWEETKREVVTSFLESELKYMVNELSHIRPRIDESMEEYWMRFAYESASQLQKK